MANQAQHAQRDHLLAKRETLAEASTRALAHDQPDADQLGSALGHLEDTIEATDPATHLRQLTNWIEADAARLEAHLHNAVPDCLHCRRQRTATPLSA